MGLLFSPNGRIGKSQYWVGAFILMIISTLLWVGSAYVFPFLFMFGFIFWWPWIAVHVKRFHDAGMSGWITAALVIGAIILYFIFSTVFSLLFGADPNAQVEMQEQIQIATENEDIGAMMDVMKGAFAQALPATLATLAALTLALGGIMSLLKSDPNTNEYGPPTSGPQADTFG